MPFPRHGLSKKHLHYLALGDIIYDINRKGDCTR